MRLACIALLTVASAAGGQERGPDGALTIQQAVAIARARGPLAVTAQARRLVAQGRARNDGAFPNPTFEWRRENLSSPLQPDISERCSFRSTSPGVASRFARRGPNWWHAGEPTRAPWRVNSRAT